MQNTNTRRGFTLIELLVVVLIIGILAAVAVPQYQKAVEKSQIAELLSIANSLQKAVDVWVLENGFPQNTIGSHTNGGASLLKQLNIELPGYDTTYDVYTNNGFVYWAECSSSNCKVKAFKTKNTSGALAGQAYTYSITYTKSSSTGLWSKAYSQPKGYSNNNKTCSNVDMTSYFGDMGFSVSEGTIYQCI